MKNNPFGLYIHIPFCEKRCKYCSFYSTTNKDTQSEKIFFNALVKHFNSFSLNDKKELSSIYFGGGTPSIMSLDFYTDVFNFLQSRFKFSDNIEVTVEFNPEHIVNQYLVNLKKLGVNRVSIGIQSLDDKILKSLNRIHSVNTAITAVENALSVFSNVSCDFIIGIKDAENEVENIKKFPFLDNISHLSIYILEGKKNFKLMASEEVQTTHYLKLSSLLERFGFFHYEISNFAKKGKEAKHNSLYWQGYEYVGLGPSAHSFLHSDGNIRRIAENSLLNEFLNGNFKPEIITYLKEDYVNEMFMLKLRLAKGVCLDKFNSRYQVDITKMCHKLYGKFDKYMNFDGVTISLNKQGFLISNEIFSEII